MTTAPALELDRGDLALLRGAHAGNVRRTASGYDLWDRRGTYKAGRVNKRVARLKRAGLLELHPDGLWRPTTAAQTHLPERKASA